MGNSQSINKHDINNRNHDEKEFEYQSRNLRRHNQKLENFRKQSAEQNNNEIQREKNVKIMCNPVNFNKLLNILSDANNVSEYYALLLIQDALPVALNNYKNYSIESEKYFNIKRKLKWRDLNMSYHDFYNELAFLNTTYEEPANNGAIRRNILLTIFEKSYKVQRHLIEDLHEYCGKGIINK